MTENLFIDVLADSERLERPGVIQDIVDGHVKGIALYLDLKKKEKEIILGKATVKVNDTKIEDGVLINETAYVPIHSIGKAFGTKIIKLKQ